MSFNDQLDQSLISSEEIIECKMKFEKKFVCSFCKFELENEEELFTHCSAHGSNGPTSNLHALNGNHIGDCNSQALKMMELDRLKENEIEIYTKMRLTNGSAALHSDEGSLLLPIAQIQQISSTKQYLNNIIYIKSSSQPKLKKVSKNISFEKCIICTCPICKIIFYSINDCDDHFAIDHRKKKHQRQRLNQVVLQRSYEKIFTKVELKILNEKSRKLRRKLFNTTKDYCTKAMPKISKIKSKEEHRSREQFTSHCEELEKSSSLEELFVVEKILEKRICDGEAEYYVKWFGYPVEESTWEPMENFNSLDAIKEYEESIIKKEGKVLIPIAKLEDCSSYVSENESSQNHLNEAKVVNVSESKSMSSKDDTPTIPYTPEQKNHMNEAEVVNASESKSMNSKDNTPGIPYTPEQKKKLQCLELIFIGDSTAKHALPRNFESSFIKTSVIYEEGASMERIAVLVDNCLSDLISIKANHRILIIIFGGHVELLNRVNRFTDSDKFFHHLCFIHNKAENSNLPQLVVIFTFPNPIDYKRYYLYKKDPRVCERLPTRYDLRTKFNKELFRKSKVMALQIQNMEDICYGYWPSNSWWDYLHLGKFNCSTKASFQKLLQTEVDSSVLFQFLSQDYFVDGFHLSHIGAISFWTALCKLLLKYVDYSLEELVVLAHNCEKSSQHYPKQSPSLESACREKPENPVPMENTIDIVTSEFKSEYPRCNVQNVKRDIYFVKRSALEVSMTPANTNPSEQCVPIESTRPNEILQLTKSYCENSKNSAPLQTTTDSVTFEFESEYPYVNVQNVVKNTDLNAGSNKGVSMTPRNNNPSKQHMQIVETTQQLQHQGIKSHGKKSSQIVSSAAVMKSGFKNPNFRDDIAIVQNEMNRIQGMSTFNTNSDIFERVFNQTFEKVRPIFREIFMEELKKEGFLL